VGHDPNLDTHPGLWPERQVDVDAVRHAFRNADAKDWEHLLRYIPDSGHGKFWKAVFAEVREALAK
jgi:hypothetical protein